MAALAAATLAEGPPTVASGSSVSDQEDQLSPSTESIERLELPTAADHSSALGSSASPAVPSLLQKYLVAKAADESEAPMDRLLLLQIANCCVSPETIACLAEFVTQLNTNLVRLR